LSEHNTEKNPKGTPAMEFEIGGEFTPDWLNEVAKYPSLEKIAEARFNLDSMKNYNPLDQEFQYTLSNFLSSSRSIFWYLLAEYKAKFGIKRDLYFTNEEYRKKHINSLSPDGQIFLQWYDGKFIQLKKEKSSFLINKRDINIHHGYVEQIFRFRQGPYRATEDQIKNGIEIPIDLNNIDNIRAFFLEVNDSTVVDLCKEYLDNIEKLVDECHNKFPLN